ncbi:MAG: polymer-forming cytoskeletal protein [Gemmatimonadaceae bacterium]
MGRRLVSLALAAIAVGAASRLDAQQRPVTRESVLPGQPYPGGAVSLSTQTQPGRGPVPRQVRTEVAILRATRLAGRIPPADSFVIGGRHVAAGETVRGTIAVARGPIEVHGRVEGDAVALHGDVIVHEGGVVRGDAVAIGGRVRARGGVVEGEIRSVSGILAMQRGPDRGNVARPEATWRAIKVVLGWLAVLTVLGIGVLVFAEASLDPVVEALQQRFARAFWYGVVAQLAAIPVLLVIVLALALTVVGILLIPFAIVAYAVALAGVLALGFLAVARFTGGSITGRASRVSATPVRGASLRALVAGLVLYLGLWLLAAAFTSSPLIGSILRAAALAVTWVAVTLGLGALIASRVTVRRAQSPSGAPAADPMLWQTPTPVTGVAAARRPVSVARSDS